MHEMKLHNIEKQLILYTKGHFKSINYKEDLKFFAAELYGIYPKHIDEYNIVSMVVSLYEKLIDNDLIRFSFSGFLSDVFKRSRRDHGSNNVDWDIVIKQMLAEIQGMSVLNKKLELGSADLSILNKEVKA